MTIENRPTGVLAMLAEFRRQIAIGLAVAAVVLGALAIWWAVRSWPSHEADKPSAHDVRSAEKPAAETKSAGPKASVDFLPAAIWAGFLAILCGISAFWLLNQPLRPGTEATAIRTELLTFGSLIGLITAMLGLLLGLRWDESLFRWINEDKTKDAKWVLIAASIFTAGLIIMFLSLQLRVPKRDRMSCFGERLWIQFGLPRPAVGHGAHCGQRLLVSEVAEHSGNQ